MKIELNQNEAARLLAALTICTASGGGSTSATLGRELNRKISEMLTPPEQRDFDATYQRMLPELGLIALAEAEEAGACKIL